MWNDARLKSATFNLVGLVILVAVSGKLVEYVMDNYVFVGQQDDKEKIPIY